MYDDLDAGLAVLELDLGFGLGGGDAARRGEVQVDALAFRELDGRELHVDGRERRREARRGQGEDRLETGSENTHVHGLLLRDRRGVDDRAHPTGPRIYSRPRVPVNECPDLPRPVRRRPGCAMSEALVLAPPAVRVHDRLPLSLPGPDDGPGLSHRRDEGPRPAPGGERWNDAARFWIRIFGDQLRLRRRHRDPDGVPVRDQLGAVLALRRQRRGPHARRWKGSSPSSSNPPFFRSSSSERSGWAGGATSRRPWRSLPGAGSPGTSSRRRTRSCSTRRASVRGPDGTLQLAEPSGVRPEPLGHRAVRPQHGLDGRDGVLRRRGAGRLLPPAEPAPGAGRGSSSSSASRRGWSRAFSWPIRPGTARPSSWPRHQPVALAAMEGRFESGPRAGHQPDRPAQRRRAPARQRRRGAGDPLGPGVRSLLQRRAGPRAVPGDATGRTTSRSSTTAFTSWRGSGRS